MARVLLDACVPRWLRTELRGVDVTTARHVGLDERPDSELLAAIEGRYDVLVTLDGNIPFQQRIANRPFAVVVMRVRDQTPESFRCCCRRSPMRSRARCDTWNEQKEDRARGPVSVESFALSWALEGIEGRVAAFNSCPSQLLLR
jgi:predicted nuclease of predicted toxin-antitoxin system